MYYEMSGGYRYGNSAKVLYKNDQHLLNETVSNGQAKPSKMDTFELSSIEFEKAAKPESHAGEILFLGVLGAVITIFSKKYGR